MSKTNGRFKPPMKTYDVKLDGELTGVVLKMRGMTAGDLIKLRSGVLDDAEAVEWVLGHVLEHNLDVDDLHDLDAWITTAIIAAWGDAIKDAAIPPQTATS